MEELPKIGSLPAFVQVKGCSRTLQRTARAVAVRRDSRFHDDRPDALLVRTR